MMEGYNMGSAKVFKSGTGLAIMIPISIVRNQKIEKGFRVEFFMRKIPDSFEEPRRIFRTKKEDKETNEVV